MFDEPLESDATTEEMNTENLSPAELKKLKNKQRKALKKAELETAQAAKAEKKKEQYNKSQQKQNQDSGDPEAPQLEELLPEKLERPDDPLGKAIDFLKPLQLLSKNLIETHLLSFEIYYRKNKILIMLQALKRAYAIDQNDARLFKCIVKFSKLLVDMLPKLSETVKTVIERELKQELSILQVKPQELVDEFLLKNATRSEALIYAADVYLEVMKTNKVKACELLENATRMNSFRLEVILIYI